jgi:hypothetical protein
MSSGSVRLRAFAPAGSRGARGPCCGEGAGKGTPRRCLRKEFQDTPGSLSWLCRANESRPRPWRTGSKMKWIKPSEIRGRIQAPASKSLMIRASAAAALGLGESLIEPPIVTTRSRVTPAEGLARRPPDPRRGRIEAEPAARRASSIAGIRALYEDVRPHLRAFGGRRPCPGRFLCPARWGCSRAAGGDGRPRPDEANIRS